MAQSPEFARTADERISWGSSIPYFLLHVLAVVGMFIWPPTVELLLVAVGAYYLRMFGITAGYHRYFAHRSYKTGRVFQFILALLGSMSSQKGVLWWAGHHRHHHKHSDQPEDIHSPKRGFWWAHHLWILCPKYERTPVEQIRDFAKYPELRFLDRTWIVWPIVFGGLLALIGGAAWGFWGGLVSTVVLWHGTFTINSLTHLWGSVRYRTTDTSKNSFILALVTMGEGWHNNHHFYQSTACQGFFWWEVDASYYILKVLSWFGVVRDLRMPPQWVLEGKSSRYPEHDRRSVADLQPVAAYVGPAVLMESLQSLVALRKDAASTDLRALLGPKAVEAADRAAELAQRAAQAAQDAGASAAELKAKLGAAAIDSAERAATLAKEASEAASVAADSVKDAAVQRWAEAAASAADTAADAATRLRAAQTEGLAS